MIAQLLVFANVWEREFPKDIISVRDELMTITTDCKSINYEWLNKFRKLVYSEHSNELYWKIEPYVYSYEYGGNNCIAHKFRIKVVHVSNAKKLDQ